MTVLIESDQKIKRNIGNKQSGNKPHGIVSFSDLDKKPQQISEDSMMAAGIRRYDVSADHDEDAEEKPRNQQLMNFSLKKGPEILTVTECISRQKKKSVQQKRFIEFSQKTGI